MDVSFSLSQLLLAEPSGVHWDVTKNSGHYHIQSPKEKWSLVLFVWSNKTLSLNMFEKNLSANLRIISVGYDLLDYSLMCQIKKAHRPE